jgi:hypothetical protein
MKSRINIDLGLSISSRQCDASFAELLRAERVFCPDNAACGKLRNECVHMLDCEECLRLRWRTP